MNACKPQWQSPPSNPTALCDSVHVWRAHLDVDGPCFQSLYETLAGTERDRAAKMRVPGSRWHFTTARGILRNILSSYLDLEPQEVRFTIACGGKPGVRGSYSLYFNLSHSENLTLIAVADSRVGVDVEYRREGIDTDAIARRFFSPLENDSLGGQLPQSRSDLFFECWTRKEAYLKAHGDGIRLPLDGFDALGNDHLPGAQRSFALLSFRPAEQYYAALAVEGPMPPITFYEWIPKRFAARTA